MKKILLASATVALLLGGSACSTDYDIYPDDMSKVLMFKDSGGRTLTVYSTQDEAPATVVVLKGGVAPEQSVTATVRAMSQEEFNEYAANAGVAYSYLPSNCYTLGENGVANLSFAGGEGYKTIDVNLDVKAIGAYLEANPNLTLAPAVPLVLECADAKIGENDNKVFLAPDYRVPTISFVGGSVELPDGANSASLELGLPFESQWEITCKVAVDPTALDEYNEANGTSYGLMPAGSYSGVQDVVLPVGEETVPLDITLDLAKTGFRTALPLRITGISLDGFELVDETAVITTDNASSYKLNLTADMLSTNDVVAGDGGGLPSLIDGNLGNWFHSSWSSFQRDDKFGSYVQYDLKSPVQSVGFDITTRPNNSAGIPKRVELYGWDGNDWVLFSNSSSYGALLTAGSQTASFGAFQAPFKFQKFRFCVKESANGVLMGVSSAYWNAAEIVVYGL